MISQEYTKGSTEAYEEIIASSGYDRLHERPTESVVQAIHSIRGAIPSAGNKPFDMFNMLSTAPEEVAVATMPSHARNLVDRGHEEIKLMKRALLRMVKQDILGIGHEAGVVTPGGSGANKMALHLARNKTNRSKVLVSDLAHVSIGDSCETLGMEAVSYPHGNMEALEQLLNYYADEIAALVVSSPDTQLGVVENVHSDILRRCKELGVHLHLDAAYGGFWMTLGEKTRARMQELLGEEWNTITTDPHKFVGFPNCGALFIDNVDDLELVNKSNLPYFGATPERYFGSTQKPDGMVSAFLHMHLLGKQGMEARAESSIGIADALVQKLENLGFSTLAPVEATIIPIALSHAKEVDYYCRELKTKGYSVSPLKIETKEHPMYGLRVVITPRPYYTEEFLHDFIDVLTEIRSKYQG